MKKIAFLINSLTSGGGAERVLTRIVPSLQKDYEIVVIILEKVDDAYNCEAKLHILGNEKNSYIKNTILTVLKLNNYIKKEDIECLISFIDIPNIINGLFNFSCYKVVSPWVYIDEKNYRGFIKQIKYKSIIKSYKRADKIICLTKEMAAFLNTKYGIAKNKMMVIPNPYDFNEIDILAQEQIENEVQSMMSTYKVAVAVGRLEEQKGYSELINIFSMVSKVNKDAALVILGEGSQREKLNELIKKEKVEDRVIFLGKKSNPFSYESKAYMYVSSSNYEGFPNALVEAMACGLPVIQTDCKTGPREILDDGKYGFLIQSYTRKKITKEQMMLEFSEKWIELLENKEQRNDYARRARERSMFYTIEESVKQYRNVIDEE